MRRLAAFALATAAAVALASCGGGEDAKLLPGTTAQEITENLDSVKQLASEEECVGAADAAQEVNAQVEALGGVDSELKQALQRGAARLNEVVAECVETTTEAVAPSTEATAPEGFEPPGQEKKVEKEEEKEAQGHGKPPKEKPTPGGPSATTPETSPPSAPEAPPSENGGTGATGGVSPGTPVGPGEGGEE